MISPKNITHFSEKQVLRFFINTLDTEQAGGGCSASTCSCTEHTSLAEKDEDNCKIYRKKGFTFSIAC